MRRAVVQLIDLHSTVLQVVEDFNGEQCDGFITTAFGLHLLARTARLLE